MSSAGGNQQQGGGLGHSAPLVTIAAPSTVSRSIAVPAGNNHPLASAALPPVRPVTATAAPPPPPPGPPAPVANVHQPPPAATPASPAPRATVSSSATTPPPTQFARVVPAKVSPSKTLDSLADQFLAEPSYRTEQLGLSPCMRPAPLARENGIARLRTLVERRAWGDVLKISSSMLNSPDDQHADVYGSLVTLPLSAPRVDASTVPDEIRQETVEIMTLQCNAWLKLRRYSDLAIEVERWNFVAHNDATARSPDWLPWSLHILAAQTQQYTDDAERTSDVLYELRDRIPKENAVWLAAVDNASANIFLRQGKLRLALGSLDRILELIPEASKSEVQTKYPHASNPAELEEILVATYKCEVLCRQGRALLQVGALPQVAIVFEQAKAIWDTVASKVRPELASHRVVHLVPAQMEMSAGLYYFAKSSYEHAMESFLKARDLLRKQPSMMTSSYNRDDWMGPVAAGTDSPSMIYSECVNNMALCCLYTCRMQDAVQNLEGLIREDPTSFLTERVAFNLCTLYELGSDSATSARRKRVLQLIAKRFFLHDVGPESFRVT